MKRTMALFLSVFLLTGCFSQTNDFVNNQVIEASAPMDGVSIGNRNIQVVIPQNSLDRKQQISIEESTKYKNPKKSEAQLLSPPVQITCQQEISRFNNPLTIVMALTEEDIEAAGIEDNLYGAYYDGRSWHYIKPAEVNFSEGYFTFETYHFSLFSKAVPTEEQRMEAFAKKQAIGLWSGTNSKSPVAQQTENIVKDILNNKLGLSDSSLEKDIISAVLSEDTYGSLTVAYENGDMDGFTQGLAALTGQKIFEQIDDLSSRKSKNALNAISENAGKIGTGVTMATAIAEGDMKGAAKALSAEIISAYPMTRMFSAAAQMTDRQINRWKDQEIEAAYQIYKNGAERDIPFWGYSVEKGDFNELWDQMRGIQTKIYSDAIDDYAVSRGIDRNAIDEATLNTIRRTAKNNLEAEFIEREKNEKVIKAMEEDHLKLLNAFKKASLFEEDLYGYTDATSFEFRMERLYKVKKMILKDANVKMAHSDSTRKKEMSPETIAKLARLWYSSDDGRNRYKEKLVELGYVKREEQETITSITSTAGSTMAEDIPEMTGSPASAEASVSESTTSSSVATPTGTLQLMGFLYDGIGIWTEGDGVFSSRPMLYPFLHLGDIDVSASQNQITIHKDVGSGSYSYQDPLGFQGETHLTYNHLSLSGFLDPDTYHGAGTLTGSSESTRTDTNDDGSHGYAQTTAQMEGTFNIYGYDRSMEYLNRFEEMDGTWYIIEYTYRNISSGQYTFYNTDNEESTNVWKDQVNESETYLMVYRLH